MLAVLVLTAAPCSALPAGPPSLGDLPEDGMPGGRGGVLGRRSPGAARRPGRKSGRHNSSRRQRHPCPRAYPTASRQIVHRVPVHKTPRRKSQRKAPRRRLGPPYQGACPHEVTSRPKIRRATRTRCRVPPLPAGRFRGHGGLQPRPRRRQGALRLRLRFAISVCSRAWASARATTRSPLPTRRASARLASEPGQARARFGLHAHGILAVAIDPADPFAAHPQVGLPEKLGHDQGQHHKQHQLHEDGPVDIHQLRRMRLRRGTSFGDQSPGVRY